MNHLQKEIDKFAKYFIIKSVQVIVQSRIPSFKRTRTECKPAGNDWFNINIVDITEVSDRTKSAIDFEGFSIRSNWRVCCEISLRSIDGGHVTLEHWIISNTTNQNNQIKTPTNQQVTPRTPKNNKTSPLSHSNNGISSACESPSTEGKRPATFSNTTRTRLNSINNSSNDDQRENIDIKTSASCFTLSSSAAANNDDKAKLTIITSPSISSLSSNAQNAGTGNNSLSSPQTKCKGHVSSSSLSTIYNRMSLLLKTIMTTSHIVPAYRLASDTKTTDSYEISYRVYATPSSYQSFRTSSTLKGSSDDVPFSPDSPNKRSSGSNSSLGSLNIREFVGPDELDSFCPILRLGSIRTDVNELTVSLCYRNDVKNSYQLVRNSRAKDMYNSISGQDCITAAKQLLAGNEPKKSTNLDGLKNTNDDKHCNRDALNYLSEPLSPAFAFSETKPETSDPDLTLIDSAFEGLLKIGDERKVGEQSFFDKSPTQTEKLLPADNGKDKIKKSEPLQVPNGHNPFRQKEALHNTSSESTPRSLSDSFVFVELNPPFASEEQNEINSFFNGPSPTFNNGFENLKDVDDITNQLAVIEADASQIDEFVDNICVTQDEERDE